MKDPIGAQRVSSKKEEVIDLLAVRRHVFRLLLFAGLAVVDIVFAVLVLLFHERGINDAQILRLAAVFSCSVAVCELPSGWYADRFGRKNALTLGAVFLTTSWLFVAVGCSFWSFAVFELLLGAGFSFISGAHSALAYDTMKSAYPTMNDETFGQTFRRFQAYCQVFRVLGVSFGALMGAGIAWYCGLGLTAWLQLPTSTLLIVLACSLKEPPRQTKHRVELSFRTIRKEIWRAIIYSFNHQQLKWLIVYSTCFVAFGETIAWLRSFYYALLELSVWWFGLLAILQTSIVALAACWSARRGFTGRKRFLWLLLINFVSCIVLAFVTSPWAIGATLAPLVAFGLYLPFQQERLNHFTVTEIRATVLSIDAMSARLVGAVSGLLIGWSIKAFSLSTAFLVTAGLFISLGGWTLWRMAKVKLS